jgi:hypothetical protein
MKQIIAVILISAGAALADDPHNQAGSANSNSAASSVSSASATNNNTNAFNPINANSSNFKAKNTNVNKVRNNFRAKNVLRNRIRTSQNQSSVNTNNITATGGSSKAIAKGGNSVAKGGRSVSRGGNAQGGKANNLVKANPNIRIMDKSATTAIIPATTLNTDFVDWKRYQWERAQHRAKGELISSLDPRVSTPVKGYVAPATAKAKYDRFLRSQGVNPKTMGASTILPDGTMYVPSIMEEYAGGKPGNSSLISQNLAAAAE